MQDQTVLAGPVLGDVRGDLIGHELRQRDRSIRLLGLHLAERRVGAIERDELSIDAMCAVGTARGRR
jgi:hypothetical protein